MNKVAVVLGVAVVATLAGCRDADFDARKGGLKQNEAKIVEPATSSDVAPEAEVKPAETKPAETQPVITVKPEPVAEVKPVAEAQPVEPEYTMYIVQRGDYLAKISKKFNIKIDTIKQLNGLKSDNIRLGQKLKLPGKVEVGEQKVPEGAIAKTPKKVAKKYTPYEGETKEYVVKSGDSLGKIAYSNGMNIRQLKELNGLASDRIQIGQKLKIAAKAAAVESAPAPVAPVVESTPAPVQEPVVAPVAPADTAAQPVESVKEEAQPAESATPAVAPTATPAAATTTYVVTEGDDLASVSIVFGTTPAVIRELNNMGDGDTLKPGQVIKLPADAQ